MAILISVHLSFSFVVPFGRPPFFLDKLFKSDTVFAYGIDIEMLFSVGTDSVIGGLVETNSVT